MANIPLLEQLTGAPLLVDTGAERLFEASVRHLVSHPDAPKLFGGPLAAADEDFWDPTSWQANYRPYNVKDGTLQIPVMGVLLHRFPYQLGRWATGYQYIEKAIARGLADGNVQRIAYVHDSPGGEVAGCFELAEKIYEARSEKPSWAFAADSMYSASYALGSAAKGISVSSSGGVGSIGVVTTHVEYSEALKEMGIKVTFIFAGKHKVDGNAYEKLSADTQKRWQARIDKIYGVFTSTVARNRGMEEDEVRATEALTYDAEDGIKVGLADRKGALDDEMIIFSDGDETAEDEQMADVKQEDHEKAVATARTEGVAAGKAEGKAEGLKEGATAERARINAILASDEGKKRPMAARSLAMNTGLTVEEASASLAGMPEEKAEAAPKPTTTGSHFEQHMQQGAPEVGAKTQNEGEDQPADKTASILSSYGAASGRKAKAAA